MSAAAPWRQASLITLAAAALLIGFHLLPAGSSLSHMDFLADKAAVLQFCDPQNSKPLPVIAGQPPVTMTLAPGGAIKPGARAEMAVMLTTISGKPIGPEDLLPRGHPVVRLLIIDPVGARFSSAEAIPGAKPGEWTFSFVPKGGGAYRASASFTPAATGTEISAASAFTVLR